MVMSHTKVQMRKQLPCSHHTRKFRWVNSLHGCTTHTQFNWVNRYHGHVTHTQSLDEWTVSMVTPHTQSSDEWTVSMVISHTQSSDEWTVSMVTSNSDEWTVSMVTSHTQSLDEWTVSMVILHTKFRWVNSFHGRITHTKFRWMNSFHGCVTHKGQMSKGTKPDSLEEVAELVWGVIYCTHKVYTYYKWESTPKKIQTFACYHWTTVATLYSEEFWNMFPGFWILKSNMDI